jgi:glycosyltransferase involved in cell wall biosynthesis
VAGASWLTVASSRCTLAPSVSVVVPTYNQRPVYLAGAVESVKAQTEPAELIVVDDGSDEPTPYTTHRHEQNRGISAALNTGIRAMTTDWFCWLSSDDMFAPEKVEMQRRDLEQAGSLCGFTRYYVFEDGGIPRASKAPIWPNHKRQRQELGQGCLINGSTVMIHRSVFDDVGLFDESFKYGQDWEMWCRIVQKYEWRLLDCFLGFRRSGGNLTERINSDEAMRAVRDAEDRRILDMYAP